MKERYTSAMKKIIAREHTNLSADFISETVDTHIKGMMDALTCQVVMPELPDNAREVIKDFISDLTMLNSHLNEGNNLHKTTLMSSIKPLIELIKPPLKKYEYQCTGFNVWCDFDDGEVEAETEELARGKALHTIQENLTKANQLLDGEFSIEMDLNNLTVTEI